MAVLNDSLYYEGVYAPAVTMGTALYKLSFVTTGVKDVTLQTHFAMYPNPNNGIFVLQSDEKTNSIEVLSVTGHLVFEQKLAASNKANVALPSNISNGTYLLRAHTDKGTAQQRFTLTR